MCQRTLLKSSLKRVAHLKFWPPPGLVACRRCSSPCCPMTSKRCWGPRKQSRAAWGCRCRSSAPPPGPPQTRRDGRRSAAPDQSQTPPQTDSCPASSSAAAGRSAPGILQSGCTQMTARVKMWHKNLLNVIRYKSI